MNRLKLDTAAPVIKKFLSSLPLGHGGVELELRGKVVCKVVPVVQFTDEEKTALIEERRRLIRRSQQRNRGVSDRVIAREVRQAIDTVRRGMR